MLSFCHHVPAKRFEKTVFKKINWFKNLRICFYDIMHIWKHVNENIKTRANFDYGVMQKRKAHPALRAEPPFFFFLIEKELGIKIGST